MVTKMDAIRWQTLVTFAVSGTGAESTAVERMRQAVQPLCMPAGRLDRLSAALGDAIAGASARAAQPFASITVIIQAAGSVDVDAAPPCGWGFFMVEKSATADRPGEPPRYEIELFLYREGE